MISPSSEVIAKRRYHKSKHKVKRRDFNRCYDKESSRVKPPARITHKRLTNKTGFYFKNAVLSSPHVRGSKAHALKRARKGSTDFDLQCLLAAAKTTNAATVAQESMSNTSEELYEPGPIDDTLIEENNDKLENNNALEPRSRSKMGGVLKSSIENNLSVGDQNLNLNVSSENRTTQTKLKIGSFSSYYKFAIGISNALIVEKEKQYKCENYLQNVERNLINIYNKFHEKLTNKDNSSTNNGNLQPEKFQDSQYLEEKRLHENMCSSLHSFTRKHPECKDLQKINDHEEKTKRNLKRHQEKEKTFKERSVEAWVEALPKNMHHQNSCNILSKSEVDQTEEEFLRNFEMKPLFRSQRSKHAPHLLKMKNSVAECKRWQGDPSKMNTVMHSISPFMHHDEYWSNPLQEPLNDQLPAFWEGNRSFPQREQSFLNQKPQQSWLSWFTKQDEPKKRTGERRLESPTCLSPTPYFIFDHPLSKRTCLSDASAKVKTTMDGNLQINNIAENKPVWNPLPKLLDRDFSKKFLSRIMTFDKHTARRNRSIEESPSIKFSPRNMF